MARTGRGCAGTEVVHVSGSASAVREARAHESVAARSESSLGVELTQSAGMPESRRNWMRWALGGRGILVLAQSLAKEAGGAIVVFNR